jgi:hypothetical protein
VIGGVVAAVSIRNPQRAKAEAPVSCPLACGLDAPPARTEVALASSAAGQPGASG